MSIKKKITTALLGLISIPSLASSGGIQESLFSILVENGAYLHTKSLSPPQVKDAGTFYLKSLSCTQDKDLIPKFHCAFTDEARPFERTHVSGNQAEDLYRSLAHSGVKETEVPFFEGRRKVVLANFLQCTKGGFKKSTVTFSCQRLKPLIEL